MPFLKSLQALFSNPNGSNLINSSNHKTPESGQLTVQIDGNTFYVVRRINYFSSISELSIASIIAILKNGQFYCVRFGSIQKQISGFICFHDILEELMPLERHYSPIKQINFSISWFNPEFFCVCFATPQETKTPNFGIGCLKSKVILEMFRKMNEFVCDIPKLWVMFIQFLHSIGYFNIFNYNDFRSFSFVLFQNLFQVEKYNNKKYRQLFYSFIECLLINNCQFLIHGQSIQHVRGRISKDLIKLFSEDNPPIVNFIDEEGKRVGITFINSPIHKSNCVAVSLLTTEVHQVGPLYGFEPINFPIQNKIMDELDKYDDDDDDEPQPLKRSSANKKDTSLVKNGRFVLHGFDFVIFKTTISGYEVIQCFIKCGDGTFELFPCDFLTFLFMFNPDKRFFQLVEHFNGSIYGLVYVLIQCGLDKIFNRTATPDELHHFLIESQFGVLLQILRCEYETHKSAICAGSRDSIREIKYFKSFTRVLQMICNLLREKKNSELSPEIYELLEFMEVLIQL